MVADRGLAVSRAAFMPDLQFQGDRGHVTTTLLQDDPVDVFAIDARVLAPVFDAGYLKAREDSAAASPRPGGLDLPQDGVESGG